MCRPPPLPFQPANSPFLTTYRSSPAPLSLRHFEAVLAAYTPPSRAAQETQAAKRRGGRGVADLPAREDSMRVLAAMFNSMLGSQQQESEEEGSV